MSAATHGAGCGAVLGLVVPLLVQQFGFISLSQLDATLEWLVGGLVVGLVLGAVIGYGLGRRFRARHPPSVPA